MSTKHFKDVLCSILYSPMDSGAKYLAIYLWTAMDQGKPLSSLGRISKETGMDEQEIVEQLKVLATEGMLVKRKEGGYWLNISGLQTQQSPSRGSGA